MKKILCNLLLGMLIPSSFAATEVDEGSIYADKPVHLVFEQGVFSAECENEKFDIPSYKVKGDIKGLSSDSIERLLNSRSVYFRLNFEQKTLDSHFRLLGGGGTDSKVIASADAALKAGGHRTTGEWLNQGGHRTPTQWWNQGNHRSIGEWLSGVKSHNK